MKGLKMSKPKKDDKKNKIEKAREKRKREMDKKMEDMGAHVKRTRKRKLV